MIPTSPELQYLLDSQNNYLIDNDSDLFLAQVPAWSNSVGLDNRNFVSRLSINGTVLDCAIVNWTVTKGSSATPEAFTIGSVISSVFTATLKNLSTNIKGQEVQVEIGLELNGDYEYVTLGYFTITDAENTAYTATVTGYGRSVTNTGTSFVPPATQTLANIAGVIATNAGCSVTFDNGIDTTAVITASLANMSNYQALQMLATTIGGFAVDTYDGNIAIHKFSDTPTLSVNSGMMVKLPEFEESDFEVSGVVVTVSEASTDDEGEVIPAVVYPTTPTGTENLFIYDSYMTESIYTNVFLPNINGYTYRPAKVTLSLGDPRLEGNDVLAVTDVNNNVYIVPCHSVAHHYDGGLWSQINAVKATEKEQDIGTKPPVTQRLDDIASATISAKASAENAQASALIAQESAETAQASASLAQESAQIAQESAESAQADANTALINAQASTTYANSALGQLAEVERVVDALEWISKHGQYSVTDDTEVVLGKWYFTLQNGSYVLVTPSEGDNPHNLGYYELTSVDEAISNYVATHLALTDDGLFVQIDDNACKLQITSTGINLYDASGVIIASYSSSVVLGNPDDVHIHLSPTNGLGFYQGTEDPNNVNVNRVAYINGNKLYISQAEITTNLRIGQFVWKRQSANRISLVYSP